MSRKLHNAILAHIHRGNAVLDVGAGMAEYHGELLQRVGEPGRLVLLDAHQPYLDRCRIAGAPNVGRMTGNAVELLPRLPDHGYDVALGIDFVEHLHRMDALAVIVQMQRIATTVLLFIPEGAHPQDTDYFKLGADYWQTHRSMWYADDLVTLGFDVDRWPDFHAGTEGKDPGALWCEWRAR